MFFLMFQRFINVVALPVLNSFVGHCYGSTTFYKSWAPGLFSTSWQQAINIAMNIGGQSFLETGKYLGVQSLAMLVIFCFDHSHLSVLNGISLWF